jgi:hypothetical protein
MTKIATVIVISMVKALHSVVASRISDGAICPRKAVGAAVIRDADWSVGGSRGFRPR